MSDTACATFACAPTARAGFRLRFRSLFHPGRGYDFPCDARGQVDLDGLSVRQREVYLVARAMIGRDLACPVVLPEADAGADGG